MKYRVTTERGGAKLVIWDIEDNNPNEYPTLLDITDAVCKEFPQYLPSSLIITPLGGGDGIILRLAPGTAR